MIRLLFIIISITILVGAVRAQQPDQQPIVETELQVSEVVPGQYVPLRVTVLVPSWLSKPVEFPLMEVPNLRVRLPERSTGPTSRTIDGAEWSGVSRRYLISPMVAGRFDIPAQDIVITYAVPGSSNPAQKSLPTKPVAITGVVPQGAEGLDPFIAAESLTLMQEVSKPTTDLQLGQSIKRTVTVQVKGASPIMLPDLMPDVDIDGIAVYPDQPTITEEDDRGVLSGTRTESMTLMAEGGAAGQVPGIELRWFNLKSSEIETTTVDGFNISIQGPPVAGAAHERSGQMLASAGLAVLIVLAVLVFLVLRFWPRAVGAYRHQRARRYASKDWAERMMKKAIRSRDYPATLRAVDEWAARAPATDAARTAPIYLSLTRIGRSIYGPVEERSHSGDWRVVDEAARGALAFRRQNSSGRLPPLNPASVVGTAEVGRCPTTF